MFALIAYGAAFHGLAVAFELSSLAIVGRPFSVPQQALGQWSNSSIVFGQLPASNLFARQGCEDAGYCE